MFQLKLTENKNKFYMNFDPFSDKFNVFECCLQISLTILHEKSVGVLKILPSTPLSC